jgi:3-oxoacyl-[acyl-carrier protein] reductase
MSSNDTPAALPAPLAAFDLTGRTAVVTGGASGIGEAAAEVLGAVGANVVVADLNLEGAEATAKRIVAAGGTAIAHEVDITSKDAVDALVDRAVAEFGGLDVMANVAGIAHEAAVADITEADVDRVVAINLKGTLFGCQAAMRAMKESGGGSIINVASASIDVGAPNYALYAMTKAAVAQLTMSMTWEVGRLGIRVNTIAPGSTVTPFTARHAYEADGTLNQAKYDEFVNRMRNISPLRQVGEAMDQAYLILYLASDASRFCTGQVWRANGGQAIVR